MITYAITYSYPTWDPYWRGQVGVRVLAASEADALSKIRTGTAGTGYSACPGAEIVRCKESSRV